MNNLMGFGKSNSACSVTKLCVFLLALSTVSCLTVPNLARSCGPTGSDACFATQSSQYGVFEASRAVDGGTNRDIQAGSCMLTEAQTDPWWRVDLEAPKQISDLKIHTRNADQRRLAGYRILVSSTINISDAVECYAAPAGVAPPEAGLVGCKASGQYVWIQVKGDGKYVQVCEVEVYPPESAVCVSDPECANNTVCTRTGGSDTCSACISGTYSDGDSCEELPNLARSCGPTGSDACFATQSSQYGVFEASRAVDGGTNRDIQAGSCMLTEAQTDPWWRVDLEAPKQISYLKIHTRNSDQRRLAGYRILVSSTINISDAVECYAAPAGVAPPEAGLVGCKASGQYVWIQVEGDGKYVQVCEVEVYPPESAVCADPECADNTVCTRTGGSDTCSACISGTYSDGDSCEELPNLARSCGPTGSDACFATQSSQYGVFEASRAVDGGTNRDIQAGSCMLTEAQTDPWWRVDLEAPKQISDLKIHTRNSDQRRLAGYRILVSSTINISDAVECYAAPAGVAPPEAGLVGCKASGQYVWIQVKGDGKYVQVCEVEVYPPESAVCVSDPECANNTVCTRTGGSDTCSACISGTYSDGDSCEELPNLARSCGPTGSDACFATQSSQYGVFEASRAVDGGTNRDIQAGSCMLTEAQTDPWWRVDLEAPKQISYLKIHTRNSDQRRLAGYRILVSSTINIIDAVECYAAPAGVAPPEAGLVGCKASGQYVWIQVKGDGKYVQVCEVEVYPPESAVCVSDPECADNTVCTRTGGSDTCSACISGTYSDGDSCEELPNLARSCGPTGSDACFATQSSQYGVFEASRAVDGGTNRDIQAGSCMLTVAEPSPFFVTDLGSIRAISYVRIYTRNSDQRRLAGFRVFLSNTPDFIDAVDSECYAAPAGVAPPEAAEVLCEASGRYLWINTPGTYVQLCEVEVYPPSSAVCLPEMVCPGNSTCTRTADGHSCTCIPGFTGFVSDGSATGACIPLPNLARSCGPAGSENCVAMQSSQYGVFEASRAVDGGTNGDIQAGSCMLTSAQTDPWWRVDLGATKQISSVKIYNRNADQGRLAGFSVRVSDTTDITNAAQCFLASPYTPPSVAEVQCEAVGRYVWIVAEGESRYLQMCEVEVYPPRIENPLAFSGASCTVDMISQCQPNSVCSRDGDNFTCTCLSGYKAEGDTCIDVNECLLEPSPCHYLAYCDDGVGMFKCTCPEGFLGDGFHCQSEAFAVRSVFNFADVSGLDTDQVKLAYARAITNDFGDGVYNLTLESPIVETAHVEVYATGKQLTINALFYTEELAKQVLEQMPNTTDLAAEVGATLLVGAPEVYRWMGRSTSDPYQVRPSGFTVETVYFDPSRLQSGCWVVEVVYTTGTDDFNAFYLPEAVGNDQLSYDFDYSATDATWPQSAEDTFSPVTHPCTTADYDASSSGLVAQASSCCLAQFIDMYRPIASFVSDVNGTYGSGCQVGGARNRPLASSDVREFEIGDLAGDGGGPDGTYVNGLFSGLSYSYGESAGVIDPYVGIYKATFYLDEVELRRKAGILKGTVGVEHTTDTFLGLINLSPTGRPVLDTFATQTAIHLEKTSYFSVSTHGVNAYTFLQYVNMRLVAIYNEDKDFSGVDESTLTTVRTDPSLAAHYVQVTFTLGSKYGVNENSGLVPLDSVRAGKGTFFNSANLQHKCLEWTGATDYSFASQDAFNTTLVQECGPGATMCDSPASIPDQFASFNIPLGVDFLPEASPTLSNNIFVDFVVSAIDLEAKGAKAGNADAPTNPSAGEAPWQMKTTLTGSIPVVQGGVNIFCDGITGKTDLKDVANVDIVVGSCDSAAELTRLRIKKDIASTQLAPDAITEINSDSIEAGLMTLVLKGNGSYFADNVGIQGVSLELEDLITVHIMQDDGTGADASVVSSVMALVTADPADNSDSSGLITNGYALNGAVFFTVDRASQRAHLEPSQELLELCPFNPPRPEPGNSPLETCVLRRDVRYRDYPWRNGAKSTAMELCANVGGNKQGLDGAQCPSSTSSDESLFFASILGNSDYAKQLAIDYAAVIADAYALNGRYRRAYWINPGYEWTPTQTGGASVFSISQKLFLFALVTLDEGISGSVGKTITDSTQFASNGPKLSRRMLLQSASDGLVDAQASVGADAFEFSVTPKSMMAQAFGVPEDRVALFVVELQLTAAEACMAPVQRQKAIQTTFVDYLSTTASSLHTVQVVSMAVDMGGESCSGERRRLRKLLAGYSAATASVEMMLVFTAGSEAFFDPEGFSKMAGIAGVEADARNSPKISTTHLDCTAVDCGVVTEGRSEDAESGSDKTALIAGIAGGAGGLGLLVGAALLFKHSRKRHMEEIPAVHAVNVADLKAQLQENV